VAATDERVDDLKKVVQAEECDIESIEGGRRKVLERLVVCGMADGGSSNTRMGEAAVVGNLTETEGKFPRQFFFSLCKRAATMRSRWMELSYQGKGDDTQTLAQIGKETEEQNGDAQSETDWTE
jgi:hypothetical protein